MTEYQFKSRCPDFIQKGIIFIMTENKKPKYTLRKVRSLFKNRSSFSSFFTHFIFPQPFNNSHSHREYASHPATKQMTMILLARGLTSTLPFLWQTTNAPQRLRAQNPGITHKIVFSVTIKYTRCNRNLLPTNSYLIGKEKKNRPSFECYWGGDSWQNCAALSRLWWIVKWKRLFPISWYPIFSNFFSAMLQNTIHHFGATTELIRIYSWSIAGTQESSLI